MNFQTIEIEVHQGERVQRAGRGAAAVVGDQDAIAVGYFVRRHDDGTPQPPIHDNLTNPTKKKSNRIKDYS